MCGLFGIIRSFGVGNPQPDELADLVTKELEFAAAQRGMDSWGYVTAGAEDHMSVARGLGCIVPTSGRRRTPLAPIVLGHTRHATHGSITIENAHPFTEGDVTLMHNGIIYNAPSKYTVDSMILAERVNDRAPVDTLRGYGSVAWLERGEPYLCRMKGGSLDVAWVSSIKYQTRFMIYASTLDQSIKYLQTNFDDLMIRRHPELPDGRVYRIDVDTLTLRREPYEMNLEHTVGKRWQDFGNWQPTKKSTGVTTWTYDTKSNNSWTEWEDHIERTKTGVWKLGGE